jgi:hypothetical protein
VPRRRTASQLVRQYTLSYQAQAILRPWSHLRRRSRRCHRVRHRRPSPAMRQQRLDGDRGRVHPRSLRRSLVSHVRRRWTHRCDEPPRPRRTRHHIGLPLMGRWNELPWLIGVSPPCCPRSFCASIICCAICGFCAPIFCGPVIPGPIPVTCGDPAPAPGGGCPIGGRWGIPIPAVAIPGGPPIPCGGTGPGPCEGGMPGLPITFGPCIIRSYSVTSVYSTSVASSNGD